MGKGPLGRIQDLVRQGRYELSKHASDEALEDDLHRIDIESAILTGRLVRVEKDDPRGVNHVIVGQAADLRTAVGAVVRFKSKGLCVIITAYEVDKT